MTDTRDYVFALVDRSAAKLGANEVLLASFAGEKTDFVRWNGARVRQPMTVSQGHLSLSLVNGSRMDTTVLSLAYEPREDAARLSSAVTTMRGALPSLPEDPYLLYSTEPTSTERIEHGKLPTPEETVSAILHAAEGTDLVGISASGPIQRGFASSLGHRLWHEVDSFQFDWSLYHAKDKAVQSSYATPEFDAAELGRRMDTARRTLEKLALPPKRVEAGSYRAYLTPAAVSELVQMLNWGGVSAKAQRTKTSPIQRLADGEARLSPLVSLRESIASGVAPSFDEVGFQRVGQVPLVSEGVHAGALVGPRTAREYGIAANADAEEVMRAAELSPGDLPVEDALRALGTGIFIGNLWYLGFSDRSSARITGMTRFATFWVEDGRVVAPLEVMRFDDTLYRMLGENLVALTRERERIQSASTYERRSVESSRLPGALISELAFTL